MEIGHETLTGFAKSWGLFYLIGLAVAVLVYTFWPGNRKRFDRAKHSILEEDDRPLDGPGDGPGDAPRNRTGDEPCR